jgi:2-C-methyl-D-erythritol 4-phosphate cytidylyltransferase
MTVSLPPAKYVALIPAAGVGARMGATIPKQYLPLAGKTVMEHTVAAFLQSPQIAHTSVVVSAEDAYIDAHLPRQPIAQGNLSVLRCGGATRKDSVRNGLQALRGQLADHDWVLVHDAARPGLTPALIAHLIQEVGTHAVGGLLALPVVDTVKRVSGDKVETISREGLWLAQTPQMFRYGILCAALDAIDQVTDEASAIEACGYVPQLVQGAASNLKITLASDLALAEMYLGLTKPDGQA